MADVEDIVDYLNEKSKEQSEFVEQLVLAESPSHLPAAQDKVFELIASELESCDYSVKHIPGNVSGGQLYAQPQKQDKNKDEQLLLGHSDTVWSEGTIKTMPLETDGSVMRGPGVFDMKAGLAQMVYALKAVHKLDLNPQVTPNVLINSDEELSSEDSEPIIRRVACEMDRVLVLEPAAGEDGNVKTQRKGIGQFNITIEGRAAHAGIEPEAGASAILELSHVIQKLHALNEPAQGISVNVGVIEGGERANVVADRSSALVDVRVPTMHHGQRITDTIMGLQPQIENTQIFVDGGIEKLPMERTQRNQQLWKMTKNLGQMLDLDLEQSSSGGCSDGNITSQLTATLDGLGPVGGGAHAATEYIELDKLVERTALLTLLMVAPPVAAYRQNMALGDW